MSGSERPQPMRRTRVLVVDDSAFMRRLVSDIILESGAFDVVGTARDGVHAVSQVRALDPDIVTLDIDMPGQDGLAALRDIMAEAPRPVVMLSAGGRDGGAEATLRALELGAVEFVRKPSGAISLDLDEVREQLLEALRAAACTNRDTLSAADEARASVVAAPAGRRGRSTRVAAPSSPATGVVCIAASTGGPAALARVFPSLTRWAETAVVIAQHMPPGFTQSLAQRLDGASPLTVREASHGEPILAGHAYIAPGGRHLRVGTVGATPSCLIDDGPTLWGVRPAADHLFRSAASVYGARCTGVVMTGMGCDGAEGLFAVRHAGGRGIVQDAESSVIAGMPSSALRHAGADAVVSLDALAGAIERFVAAGEGHRP
jgi:two-component system chemotaxis response regulator CheB